MSSQSSRNLRSRASACPHGNGCTTRLRLADMRLTDISFADGRSFTTHLRPALPEPPSRY